MTGKALVGGGVIGQLFGFSVSWVKVNESELGLTAMLSDAGRRRYVLDAVLAAHKSSSADNEGTDGPSKNVW